MVLWRRPLSGRAGHPAPARGRWLHLAAGRRPGKPRPQCPDHHRSVLAQARRSRPVLTARRRRLLRGDLIRSRRLRREHVYIAGGANSAGQAAVNLARYARQITIVVRGGSLAARMSRYLIDEISATPNIDVRTGTHITAAEGAGKLEALALADAKTGRTETVPASA